VHLLILIIMAILSKIYVVESVRFIVFVEVVSYNLRYRRLQYGELCSQIIFL
jgi:hypothetical protein